MGYPIARKIRVCLLDASNPDAPGSMRAYCETLQQAMSRYSPSIVVSRRGLYGQGAGRWQSRLDSLAMIGRARRTKRGDFDLWHVLDGSRAYVSLSLPAERCLITVHDLIPMLQAEGAFPQAPPVGHASKALWRLNLKAIRRAGALVFDSQATLNDAERLGGFQVQNPNLPGLPMAASLEAMFIEGSSDSGRNCADRFEAGVMLHVGNNAFYKNREQVLAIFATLAPAIAKRLLMVGPPPTEALRAKSEQLGISTRVAWIEDCDDARLAALYRESTLMIFPSLYEGFGWPVLEAMAFGLPVIATSAGSVPEVAGDAATTLDPMDTSRWKTEIEQLLSSPTVWDEARERGFVQAKRFGSRKFAEHMETIYQRACDRTVVKENAE